ncbi:MAG: hypothetical protein P9M14_04845 [Candidatus Alcyoniella australis]|nr:hypothetical protein [Candidatus Alcyoniella australis]
MSEKTIDVEANSLEEARQQIRAQIPEGLHLLSEKVLSDGNPKTIKADSETTEAAFAKVQSQIPGDANAITKKEITAPGPTSIIIKAFDEQNAKTQVEKQISNTAILKAIRLVASGKKGFLGFGKKPNQYEADIFQQAVVEVTYKQKARISAKIGKFKRSANEMQKLDSADRNNSPVEIICEQCGRECKALGRPLGEGTVMVFTPDVAIIASRYCEKCNIVVCGGCTGVSRFDTGMRLSGRPCPQCGGETTYAAASHLRKTKTKLI